MGDLERLTRVIENIADGRLLAKLNLIRDKGRNDWSVVSKWHAFISGIVFKHKNDAGMLRELNRNGQLRDICGFEPKKEKLKDGTYKIYVAPSTSAFSRFIKNLKVYCGEELNEVFENLVKYIYDNLEDFGEYLAIDGKAVQSYATTYSKETKEDGRRDTDANWGLKNIQLL